MGGGQGRPPRSEQRQSSGRATLGAHQVEWAAETRRSGCGEGGWGSGRRGQEGVWPDCMALWVLQALVRKESRQKAGNPGEEAGETAGLGCSLVNRMGCEKKKAGGWREVWGMFTHGFTE